MTVMTLLPKRVYMELRTAHRLDLDWPADQPHSAAMHSKHVRSDGDAWTGTERGWSASPPGHASRRTRR